MAVGNILSMGYSAPERKDFQADSAMDYYKNLLAFTPQDSRLDPESSPVLDYELPGAEKMAYLEDAELNYTDLVSDYDQLKSFAQVAWRNYGIDVTRPDASDPDSMAAHNTYLRMLASIRDRAGKATSMKSAQDAAQKAAITSRQDPDKQYIAGSGGLNTESGIYGGRAVDSASKQAGDILSRYDSILAAIKQTRTSGAAGKISKRVKDQANQVIKELEVMKARAESPEEANQIDGMINSLIVGGAVADPTGQDIDSSSRRVLVSKRPSLIRRVMEDPKEGLSLLESVPNVKIAYRDSLDKNKIIVSFKDGTQKVINTSEGESAARSINEILNMGSDAKISYDEMLTDEDGNQIGFSNISVIGQDNRDLKYFGNQENFIKGVDVYAKEFFNDPKIWGNKEVSSEGLKSWFLEDEDRSEEAANQLELSLNEKLKGLKIPTGLQAYDQKGRRVTGFLDPSTGLDNNKIDRVKLVPGKDGDKEDYEKPMVLAIYTKDGRVGMISDERDIARIVAENHEKFEKEVKSVYDTFEKGVQIDPNFDPRKATEDLFNSGSTSTGAGYKSFITEKK